MTTKEELNICIIDILLETLSRDPMAFLEENNMSIYEACALRYLLCHEQESGIEDLQKAKEYIDLVIETKYRNQ